QESKRFDSHDHRFDPAPCRSMPSMQGSCMRRSESRPDGRLLHGPAIMAPVETEPDIAASVGTEAQDSRVSAVVETHAREAAVLPRDLVRKVVVATLAGALVFAALALYADIRELTAAAQRVSMEA